MNKRSSKYFSGTAAMTAAALVLAACGSSGTTKASAPTTTAAPAETSTSASSSASPAAGAAIVTIKTDSKLGRILADGAGKTLYTLTSNGKAVPCADACAKVWPPLELPPGVTSPVGAPGVADLGSAPGPAGTQLVTVGGMPVYRFQKDQDAGDAYGEGIQTFGGTWHVVKVGNSSTTGSSASSGSGYSG
ncbi:MAG: COG4315 family predicted lipoprotein [Acidimicrobiales bacterium]